MSKDFKNQEVLAEMTEELIHVNRIVKVTKGGRKFRFAAMLVVGDENGKVGLGYGKAKEVPDAIKKATNSANKKSVSIFLKNKTIPHEVVGEYGGSKVILKPARPGTGIIAGGVVRSVVSKAGITDLLSKVYGSKNSLNVSKATLKALVSLNNPVDIAKKRGKKLSEIFQ